MRKMGSLVITSLFIVTIALVLLGVVMVMSSSQYVSSSLADGNVYEYMGKQLIWFSIGLAGLGFFSMYDYNLWQPKARFLMLLALFLLVLILIPPFGFKSHGATRWLNTPFVKVQPSDFAKLTIVLYLAAVWAERKEELGSFVKGILYPNDCSRIGALLDYYRARSWNCLFYRHTHLCPLVRRWGKNPSPCASAADFSRGAVIRVVVETAFIRSNLGMDISGRLSHISVSAETIH